MKLRRFEDWTFLFQSEVQMFNFDFDKNSKIGKIGGKINLPFMCHFDVNFAEFFSII